MKLPAGTTLDEAREIAMQTSIEQPGIYVTLSAAFGIYLDTAKRLHVFAPSDSIAGGYWLNGKFKPFTNAQKSADERATPMLS